MLRAKKSLFLATLLFAFSSQARVLDRIVAIVGNTPILLSEAEEMLALFTKNPNIANFYGVGKKKISLPVIVEMLVAEEVIRNTLEELNASIQEADIQKQIQSIATQNKITVDQLRASLRREGITFESYRKNIRLQLEKRSIFEREIRSSSNNVSDAELRAEFSRIAKPEWSLHLWATENTAQVKKIMSEEASSFKEKKKTLEMLKKDYSIQDLGWVSKDTLNPAFEKALSNAKAGDAVGPVVIGNVAHILFISATRQGSEEQFQAMKEDLIRRRQGDDLESLFTAWLEQKKKETRVVVNQ